MLATTNYPHLETTTDRPDHLKRLPRIHVAQIISDYLTHGWSVIESAFPPRLQYRKNIRSNHPQFPLIQKWLWQFATAII